MQNAGDLAALVAAFFFAAGVCAGVYVLVRLARLISAGTRLLADMRSRSDTVFEQVHAAVDRANQQLDATSSVTAGMDELNAGMSQLTEQVSALAGLGRAIAAGPAGRAAALVYGVRHAVAIRRDGTGRPGRAVAPAPGVAPAPAGTHAAAPAVTHAPARPATRRDPRAGPCACPGRLPIAASPWPGRGPAGDPPRFLAVGGRRGRHLQLPARHGRGTGDLGPGDRRPARCGCRDPSGRPSRTGPATSPPRLRDPSGRPSRTGPATGRPPAPARRLPRRGPRPARRAVRQLWAIRRRGPARTRSGARPGPRGARRGPRGARRRPPWLRSGRPAGSPVTCARAWTCI